MRGWTEPCGDGQSHAGMDRAMQGCRRRKANDGNANEYWIRGNQAIQQQPSTVDSAW